MGHYYGSCPPGETISFTELEYRTATAAGLPRLMFVAPDDFPIPASLRESDASFERQQAFRQEVMTERVVAVVRHAGAARERGHQGAVRLARGAAAGGEPCRAGAPKHRASLHRRRPRPKRRSAPNPYRGLGGVSEGRCRAVLRARGAGRSALERVPRAARERRPTARRRSGCWRSSALRARASPRSRRRGCWPSWTSGRCRAARRRSTWCSRPRRGRSSSLAVALARQATDDPAPAKKASEFEQVLRAARRRTTACAISPSACSTSAAGGLILLVDQFEELYSLCDDEQERAAFIGNLLRRRARAARAASRSS